MEGKIIAVFLYEPLKAFSYAIAAQCDDIAVFSVPIIIVIPRKLLDQLHDIVWQHMAAKARLDLSVLLHRGHAVHVDYDAVYGDYPVMYIREAEAADL